MWKIETSEFCFSSKYKKEHILQIILIQNLRREPVCSINFWDSSSYFELWPNIFFCARYLLVLMVVSEITLEVFFQKNVTLIGDTQGVTWNLMTKIKENWFYCGFGQWFLVWQTKQFSEIVMFWNISTQAITITTRICPQSSI